jgi:hypothetical protein
LFVAGVVFEFLDVLTTFIGESRRLESDVFYLYKHSMMHVDFF